MLYLNFMEKNKAACPNPFAPAYRTGRPLRLCALILLCAFAPLRDLSAQRVALKQLERYLGQPIPNRSGYVGLTDTLGDQRYKKLDSIIVSITDSLIGLIPPPIDTDTDQQYLDSAYILNDTLYLSIFNDGQPVHRIDLTAYQPEGDHDWYTIGTTTAPTDINDYKYSLGKITVGENAYFDQDFAVPMSDIRVHDIVIGYSADGNITNLRVGKNSLTANTTGYFNVGIGTGTLLSNTTGESNMAIGSNALTSNTTGIKLTAIGVNSLINNTTGNFNTGVGYLTLYQNTDGSNSTAIGFNALQDNLHSNNNLAIGNYAMYQSQGIDNVVIGIESGRSVGDYNTVIGNYAANYATGDYNVFIGRASGYYETGSNKLYIENSASFNPLIYGDFAGDTVRINGSLQVTNRTGTPNALAGWRYMDSKATEVQLGTGFELDGDTLRYTQPDLDQQTIDTFEIVSNQLRNSLVRDGEPYKYVDLTPYMDNTDNQYLDSAFILNDTIFLSIFGDGRPASILDLKSYIDTAFADTDEQRIDSLYFAMDTLYISLERDGEATRRVYLDFSSALGTDKQQFDEAYILNDTLFLSLQRDSVPTVKIDLKPYLDDTDTDKQYADTFEIVANQLRHSLIRDGKPYDSVDLTPYMDNTDNQVIDTFDIVGNILRNSLSGDGEPYHSVDLSPYIDAPQTYAHSGTTSYTNTLSLGGGSFSINGLTGIGIAHNGTGGINISNTGMITWLLNGSDDAYSSTTITDGTTVNVQGSGGITAKLASNGSNTLIIEGTVYPDNYVTGMTFAPSTSILTLTRTGALGSLTATVMDHDWYEVGTTRPPDAITDEMFHTGKTGIGMNPVWLLDVAEDARINGHQIGRGYLGSDQSNLAVGIDALKVNVFDGLDNTAIGAYSQATLNSGDYNTSVGSKSLNKANSFYNNAFGAYSLYNTTTGSNLIGIGYRSLYTNVSGVESIAIGTKALESQSSVNLLLAIGQESMRYCDSCYDNTAIGHYSQWSSTKAEYNTSVGHGNLYSNLLGSENTTIGDFVLLLDINAVQNVGVGRFVMENALQSTGNTAVGNKAMYSTPGTSTTNQYNVAIGYEALYNMGSNLIENIVIGKWAGIGSTGNYNVIIGNSQTFSTSGNIILANGLGTVALKMLTSGYVGIGGELTPTQSLHVTGNARVTGAYYDSNNDPGTAGQVLSSTVTGTDWVAAASGSGSGTVTSIGLTQPASGITVTSSGTNPITTAGTFTLALNADLLAVENLATNGMVARTATNTWTTRTLTAGTNISITNGDGVSGNPTITNTMANPTLGFSPGSSTILHFVNPGGSTVIFQAGTGVALSATSTTMTISASEVDGSISNEGSLTAANGLTSDAAKIHSNTSTSTDITLQLDGFTRLVTGNTISFTQQHAHWIASTGQLYGPTVGMTFIAGTGISFTGSTDDNLRISSTNTGTVTSVGITAGAGISVSGSPITSSGSITITSTTLGTVTSVAASAPASGFTISGSPISSSGTLTFALNNDLLALENLSTTGLAVRTGTSSWTTRSIVAGSGISVSNGDGVSNNITISATGGGTVTSVGITNGGGISVSGSPITSSGSITLTATDASLNNEGLLSVSGTTTRTISSNTSGSGSVAISGSGTVTVGGSGNSITITGTGGSGTVTSVGITNGGGISVSGSPITGSGSITLTATDASATNEAQTWTNGGSSTNWTGTLTSVSGVGGGAFNVVGTTNKITVSYSAGTTTIGMPDLTSVPTGESSGGVVFIDGSGTIATNGSLLYNSGTGYFTTPVLRSTSIPIYANDAAASSLASGTLYMTSTGEARIKL
jgi:hypothetical protein